MKKDKNLFLIIRKKYREVVESVNKDLRKEGVTMQHVVYLLALQENDKMTIKQLNDYLDNDGALTTRAIKQLSENGYVEKIGDKIRSMLLVLTPKGTKIVKNVQKTIDEKTKQSFVHLSLKDYLSLKKIARKLA